MEKVMGNKLFVGGLAWGTDESSLREAFEGFGAVREAKVITDRETGRSRGFGFVTFENEVDAKSAISGMDGQNLDGRNIRVNEAEDKRGGGGGSRDGYRGNTSRPEPVVQERRGAAAGYSNDRDTGGGRPPSRGGGRNRDW